MSWMQFVIIGLLLANTVAVIDGVGKPRKPITTSSAIIVFLVNSLVIWWITSL